MLISPSPFYVFVCADVELYSHLMALENLRETKHNGGFLRYRPPPRPKLPKVNCGKKASGKSAVDPAMLGKKPAAKKRVSTGTKLGKKSVKRKSTCPEDSDGMVQSTLPLTTYVNAATSIILRSAARPSIVSTPTVTEEDAEVLRLKRLLAQAEEKASLNKSMAKSTAESPVKPAKVAAATDGAVASTSTGGPTVPSSTSTPLVTPRSKRQPLDPVSPVVGEWAFLCDVSVSPLCTFSHKNSHSQVVRRFPGGC